MTLPIIDHKKLLDELLTTRNGLEVNSIHFVAEEILEIEETEKLKHVGLESYEPVYFSVKGFQYPAKKGFTAIYIY